MQGYCICMCRGLPFYLFSWLKYRILPIAMPLKHFPNPGLSGFSPKCESSKTRESRIVPLQRASTLKGGTGDRICRFHTYTSILTTCRIPKCLHLCKNWFYSGFPLYKWCWIQRLVMGAYPQHSASLWMVACCKPGRSCTCWLGCILHLA